MYRSMVQLQASRRRVGKAYSPNPRHCDAGDVATDMLFEREPPGDEADYFLLPPVLSIEAARRGLDTFACYRNGFLGIIWVHKQPEVEPGDVQVR